MRWCHSRLAPSVAASAAVTGYLMRQSLPSRHDDNSSVAESGREPAVTAWHTGLRAMLPTARSTRRSRSAFYTQRMTDVASDQRAIWRLAKELLHSDDRPPTTSLQDAAKLCNEFGRFFTDKLQKIADTITSRLSSYAPAFHRQQLQRHDPCLTEELSVVTVGEVERWIAAWQVVTCRVYANHHAEV